MDVSFEKSQIISGVEKMAKAVGSTMGPEGQLAVIRSQKFTNGISVTKDGWNLANNIKFENEIEELGAQILRQAAKKVSEIAGDNTTTTIVIAETLIKGLEKYREEPDVSKLKLLRWVDEIADEVIEYLGYVTQTVDDLERVATISANNDEEIGELIASAYREVGNDGVVIAEMNYATPETYMEVVDGIELEQCGFTTPAFANQEDGTVKYENTKVLVYDGKIELFEDLARVISSDEKLDLRKTPLTIVAEMSRNVLYTLVLNKNNGMKINVVTPPPHGFRRKDILKDLAFLTNATYIDENVDDFSSLSSDIFGDAVSVKSTESNTVFVSNKADKSDMAEKVDQLREALSNEPNAGIKNFISKRIGYLTSGIARIYVGGTVDTEQKEKYDRVEDAVLACKSAAEGGIIAGGGIAMYDAALQEFMSEHLSSDRREESIVASVFCKALAAPANRILSNAGLEPDDVLDFEAPDGYGYNLITNEGGDMIEMGVIDTFIGAKSALESAVSVAKNIFNISTIVKRL